MNDLTLLLERLKDGLSLLEGEEKAMATESLVLARLHFTKVPPEQLRESEQDANLDPGKPAAARKKLLVRLGQLSELLGRRRAQAMPYAALTRALIAYIHDDAKTKVALLEEADLKLSMYGL